MIMPRFSNSPFEAQLEVVATLRDRAIKASVEQMRANDELIVGVRQAMKNGVSIDELSEASGLSPQAISRRLSEIDESVAELAGLG
jgi:hypothetical protein